VAELSRQHQSVFTYQDGLRAVGAWLDVRGYREIRIVERDGTLVVEAAPATSGQAVQVEVLRFDADRIARLRRAALSDRGAPRAYPRFDPTASRRLTVSCAEGESVPGRR
jgi:hypothetical protein